MINQEKKMVMQLYLNFFSAIVTISYITGTIFYAKAISETTHSPSTVRAALLLAAVTVFWISLIIDILLITFEQFLESTETEIAFRKKVVGLSVFALFFTSAATQFQVDTLTSITLEAIALVIFILTITAVGKYLQTILQLLYLIIIGLFIAALSVSP